MNEVAVVGAGGALGQTVVAALERADIRHRVVGRDAASLARRFPAHPLRSAATAEAGDRDAMRAALAGADTVIYLVGVPYDRFALHPALTSATLEAAVDARVERFVLVGTVYVYGRPQTRPVSELHPRVPRTFKGKMRLAQEQIVLGAHQSGRIAATVVRLPDFYGPGVELSFLHGIFAAALAGKRADAIGPIDVPHEFLYVPDAGPALVALAARSDGYGSAYNLGGAGTITMREAARLAFRETGAAPRLRVANKLLLRLLGVRNPFLRELVEMHYLWTDPVILDDKRLRALLGPLAKTPYEEGIRASVVALRAGGAT